VIVKTEEKIGHGLGGLIDGDAMILRGKRVLLFEDMSTTFESPLHAMKTLEQAGAVVASTLLINTWNLPVFRANSKHYTVYALCTGQMIFDYAVVNSRLEHRHELILSRWFEHPEDESWSKDGKWELPT
jgi:orotate phosphoribosyltransferase